MPTMLLFLQAHWPVLSSHWIALFASFTDPISLQLHLVQPKGFEIVKLKNPVLHLSHFIPTTFCLQIQFPWDYKRIK